MGVIDCFRNADWPVSNDHEVGFRDGTGSPSLGEASWVAVTWVSSGPAVDDASRPGGVPVALPVREGSPGGSYGTSPSSTVPTCGIIGGGSLTGHPSSNTGSQFVDHRYRPGMADALRSRSSGRFWVRLRNLDVWAQMPGIAMELNRDEGSS
jgi:hypothetical protein